MICSCVKLVLVRFSFWQLNENLLFLFLWKRFFSQKDYLHDFHCNCKHAFVIYSNWISVVFFHTFVVNLNKCTVINQNKMKMVYLICLHLTALFGVLKNRNFHLFFFFHSIKFANLNTFNFQPNTKQNKKRNNRNRIKLFDEKSCMHAYVVRIILFLLTLWLCFAFRRIYLLFKMLYTQI